MKKYFLHDGTESCGPFDIEELKAKKITKKTPVWFEGMEHWKTAGEIPELTSLFSALPPPISFFSPPPVTPKVEKTVGERKIFGLSRTTFLIAAGVVSLTAATIVFKSVQENRSRELKLKNHKTQVENYQYQLQQKEIEEQKTLAAEEEKAAAERLAKGRKEAANNRLVVIQQTLVEYQTKLEETEKKLINSAGFKLLRTASDKKQQMDLLQNNINFYQTEMDKLRNASDQLKLELEKTQ